MFILRTKDSPFQGPLRGGLEHRPLHLQSSGVPDDHVRRDHDIGPPHQSASRKHKRFIHLPRTPLHLHLCTIPRIQQLFFSPFFSFFCVCLFPPGQNSFFTRPCFLCSLSISSFPVSVNPCHKNELNLSPLVQTTMEWGSLLENKSAFRPFWGCGEGRGEGVGGWGRRMRSRSDGRVAAVLVY